MMFIPVASSSKGNAYWVTDGDSAILLDCGLTLKELRKRAPLPLSSTDACFVTHEHGDHSKCAARLIGMGIPVYMSEGTARALDLEDAWVMDPGETIAVGALRIMSFPVFHNTAQPFGYLIYDTHSRDKLLFALDTVNLNVIVPDLTQIAIECNYSEDLLSRLTKLPDKTKDRIRRSHMELETAITYIHKLDTSRVRTIYLMHLSSGSGDACRFQTRFAQEFPHIETIICEE